MIALCVVLAFPLILLAGYGGAYALLRDRLAGWVGLALYVALLTVPLAAVLSDDPALPASCFVWAGATPAWVGAGVAAGLALAAIRRLTARGESKRADVWAGPPGPLGYLAVMVPVVYIVTAEEIVWRGYLQSKVGLPVAAAAFALHHYHFGLRHVLFTFGAGVAWGALCFYEERLYGAFASHLTYNAVAWAWMRRQVADTAGNGHNTGEPPSGHREAP